MFYICNEQLKITTMKKVIHSLSVVIFIILLTSCFHTDNSTFVEVKIDKGGMIKLGYPERIVNQYKVVRTTKRFSGKSFFIVDTKENLIFLFDRNGKFVAKSPTIDGFDKQSNDTEKIKNSLKSWREHVSDIGFKWDFLKQQYIDETKKNRVYSHQQVYSFLGKNKLRFFPKGIYKITRKYHKSNFVGNGKNTYDLNTLDGKEMSLAIHGLYKSQYRINNMKLLVSVIGSDYTDVKVSKKFKNLIYKNNQNGMFNNSFGCINVPQEFLELSSKNAVNSLVFVLGESDIDYLNH